MKRIITTLIIISVLINVISCSNTNKVDLSEVKTVEKNNTDPVASFKNTISERQSYISKKNVVWKVDKGWSRGNTKVTAVNYDVKKTDSLVSPYSAVVVFDIVTVSAIFSTEAEAKNNQYINGDKNSEPFKSKCRETYSFQEEKWIVKEKEYGFISPYNGEEKWFTFSETGEGARAMCGFV